MKKLRCCEYDCISSLLSISDAEKVLITLSTLHQAKKGLEFDMLLWQGKNIGLDCRVDKKQMH
jgi:hypothetical protein